MRRFFECALCALAILWAILTTPATDWPEWATSD